IRTSGLGGIQFEGVPEAILSNLFADDTTVFLGKGDDIRILLNVLDKWCAVSGAKFNIPKTVLIPLGDAEYRAQLRTTRLLSPESEAQIPDNIHIAGEHEPVRILGAFFGYGLTETDIWAPVVSKAKATTSRWAQGRPTIRGLTLGNNTMLGGYTQYLTRVQGMPEATLRLFEKMADDLIHAKQGEEKTNTIGVDTLRSDIEAGGLRALNMRARNEAIELMKLRIFLLPPELRPRWCEVAERILAENAVLKFANQIGSNFMINPLTQSWRVNLDSQTLPASLKRMMRTALKYGAKLVPFGINQTIRKRMPYWFH
ncbi:hypothetical protein DFP72DRAFT_755827, partial [Ephemerocybe angulata]